MTQPLTETTGDGGSPVYDWFAEGFDTLNLRDAKALLDDLS